jgi:hypothetical protein
MSFLRSASADSCFTSSNNFFFGLLQFKIKFFFFFMPVNVCVLKYHYMILVFFFKMWFFKMFFFQNVFFEVVTMLPTP